MDAAELLAPADMVAFVLGSCSNVAAARAAMREIRVWPCVVEQMGFPPPLHVALHDAAGNSVVLEWRDGETTTPGTPDDGHRMAISGSLATFAATSGQVDGRVKRS